MSKENERFNELINGAPTASQGAQTAQAAAALAAAENAAKGIDYSHTADARLDKAINEVLTQSGFNYDLSKDNAYKEFAREYSQNALRGRESAQRTANQLSGGWSPTYADTVGSEVSHDIVSNLANYNPSFRAAARQEAADQQAQAMNTAQVLESIADTGYSRNRDTVGDVKNYINYLADRYGTERQSDAQRQEFEGEIWRNRLSGAAQNLSDVRKIDNTRYQFNTQSAENSAKLAADQRQFEQKQAYTAAKDAYDDRIAAQKAAEAQQKAEASAAKTAATEAEKFENTKDKYGRIAARIKYNLENNKGFTPEQMYDYDFNKDGVVDSLDLKSAINAANTGVIQTPIVYSAKTSKIISKIEKQKELWESQLNSQTTEKERKKEIENLIKRTVENSNINDGESAFIYQHFGM